MTTYSPFSAPSEWSQAFANAQNAHAELRDSAGSWATRLRNQLQDLLDIIETPDWSVDWNVVTGAVPVTWGESYRAPDDPTATAPSGSAAPSVGVIPTVPVPGARGEPTWVETLPAVPGLLGELSYGTAPILDPITLPTFSVTVPSDSLDALVSNFSYAEGTYVPTLKTAQSTAILGVLNGEPIIGAETFQDIYSDAADDVTALFTGEALQAGNTCGMLGALPSEALASRLDVATAKHRQGINKVRLSAAVEQAKAWREDLWKGVDAAQAFEVLWTGFFTQEMERRLKVSIATVEMAVAVYNANVARFNAVLAKVQAHVAVSGEERARAVFLLEEYRTKLEGRKNAIEATLGQVQAWSGQWEAYSKAAGASTALFDSKVKMFQAAVEQNKVVTDAHVAAARNLIDKETAITQRFAAEWQALGQKAQATLAAMQTSAIPAETKIKSEETRLRMDLMIADTAQRNAQNELLKSTEISKLRLNQIQFAAQQSMSVNSTVANLMAHTMGAYLAAGSINYGATATGSTSTSNSWSYSTEG